MPRWTFEPGHTAAVFKARHIMVTWVRGHFVNIHGTLQFDPAAPGQSTVNVDKGPLHRAGFVATTTINRHDFGVSWQGAMDKGGVVVGNDVFITIDAEALVERDGRSAKKD